VNTDLINLIKKYDHPGPRYTSYPPAPVFSPEFGPQAFREAVTEVERTPSHADLSLYLHIPFCDTLCYFCGCTTIITQNTEHLNRYLGYLYREIDLLAGVVNDQRRVLQLHLGGGTPTYLAPSQITELGNYLHKSFAVRGDAELSVEVDPRDITHAHLKALRDVRFNRISLGVQDFDLNVQRAVNRNQSELVTRQVIDWSRELGFSSLNIDLIYGLPLQTVDSFTRTLEKVIDISPERIAVYNFAYVPWIKKQQKLIHGEDLPSAETKLQILSKTIDMLTRAGYIYIGMDHFARPDDELTVAQKTKTLHRNFQGYSTRAGSDLYGLGMSAISHFGTYYAQNVKTLQEYYHALEQGDFATHVGYKMTFDDEIRKFVIMRLMCDLTLSKRTVEEKYSITFDDYFRESMIKLTPLLDDRLIISEDEALAVTPEGRLFLRNIALCFDAHASTSPRPTPVYSRTV